MQEGKVIYFISGLGADQRAFQNLRLPEGYTQIHLEWLAPRKNESLPSYASRMAADIPENAILAGLSFGGIVAQEIARLKPVSKLILISTVKSKKEMPPWFRVASQLHLYTFVGKWMLIFPKFIPHFFFGVKKISEKKLLDTILKETDSHFLRWAVKTALKWRGGGSETLSYHIHGEIDKIFPIQYLKADAIIKGAGHLAVVTHSKEVSAAILKYLTGFENL